MGRKDLQADRRKTIKALRGKDGSVHIVEKSLGNVIELSVVQLYKSPTGQKVAGATVTLYRHEAMRLYEFLGKVLA